MVSTYYTKPIWLSVRLEAPDKDLDISKHTTSSGTEERFLNVIDVLCYELCQCHQYLVTKRQ